MDAPESYGWNSRRATPLLHSARVGMRSYDRSYNQFQFNEEATGSQNEGYEAAIQDGLEAH